ncbi:MAG: shikimate kinase [Chitinophagaceae bacterium]
MRLFLIGFMGTGKSHWGALLSVKFAIPFFDLDTAIEEAEQMTIAMIFEIKGEEYFRYREKELLERLIADTPDVIISCGGGTPCFFNNIQLMRDKGMVIWLNTTLDVLINRLVKQKMSRPLIRNIADQDLADFITRKLSSRRIYYSQANLVVNEETLTVDTFAEMITHA